MPLDRRALEAILKKEFPDLELNDWYTQFRGLKAEYPDAILFYRMGDFYEAFDDDAKLVAEKLGVTLTAKEFASPRGSKERRKAPMAGMPYHAVERYAAELVRAGYRIAIAEQISETASSKADTRPRSVFAHGLEQTATSKGMVERKVVRVLTPGTVTDQGMLAAEQNNYLAAVIRDGGLIGVAFVDLSTGEFAATEISGERADALAQSEIERIQASEILVPDKPELRPNGLAPASARLTQDLAFMSKEEREMLLPGERIARPIERENTSSWAHGRVTATPGWRWEARTAREALLHQLGASSLAGYGLADRPLAARACGAIIQYLGETQAGATAHITTLRNYTLGDTMVLDPQTRRNLELLEGTGGRAKGSLVSILDQTRTPMGARTLRRWISQPLLDIAMLTQRQQAIRHFVEDTLLRAEVRELLKQVGDIERVVNRVMQGTMIATPRDLARLRDGLRVLPALFTRLAGWLPPLEELPLAHATVSANTDWLNSLQPVPPAASQSAAPSFREQREGRRRVQARYEGDDLFGEEDQYDSAEHMPAGGAPADIQAAAAVDAQPVAQDQQLFAPAIVLDPCAEVLALLEEALDDDPPALLGASNYLRGSSDEGDKPRRVIRPGYQPAMDAVVRASKDAHQWISDLEAVEQKRTGIKGLRVDYNKVFGYYIEVSRNYADQVPGDYIRKQTLTSGERYVTPTLKKYEEIVENAQQRLVELERRAFLQICQEIGQYGPRLLATARTLAAIDVFAGLAEAAVRGRYVQPTLYHDTRLAIVHGRHPVVERTLDGSFIANNVALDTDLQQLLIVTGPNMAGKSTVLRQVALIVLMAQIGSFVPADSAEIGLVDRIFTRIGAQDDIATGQSTFMVEMTETAALLQQSTRRSLIILDEVGRGTSTYDGLAIARAVVEYIHNEPRLGCRTLFATHYHELTALEGILPRIRNYHMAALEQADQIVFLHEFRPGGADRSYGIHVAELAGIPRSVIRRANELLGELEGRPLPERKPAASRNQRSGGSTPDNQMPLFEAAAVATSHPALELLRALPVNELTPLEALTKLYELQKLANG
jgi:DNA mismatch repair protein MutS